MIETKGVIGGGLSICRLATAMALAHDSLGIEGSDSWPACEMNGEEGKIGGQISHCYYYYY